MTIKFIKDYPNGGAPKGLVLTTKNKQVANKMINDGYAEEVKSDTKSTNPKPVKEVIKKEVKVNENKCKGCGDVSEEDCEDCTEKKVVKSKKRKS